MSLRTGFITVALTLCLATAAVAVPNFLGPTGLLFTPTANMLEEGGYNVMLTAIEHASDVSYAANYGFRPNLEIGFTRLGNRHTIINAKYQIQPETVNTVGVALGVMDLTDQTRVTPYIVAGKRLTNTGSAVTDQVQFNLGLSAGNGNDEIPVKGLFGGVSFDATPRLTLMLEHDGHDLNYGARLAVTNRITGQLGLVDGGDHLAFGASYNGL